MRKEIFRMERPEAEAFLARANVVHIATTGAGGEPVFRTVNAAVLNGRVVFHGAPAGEKMEAIGRQAVVCAEETVASIPSYFLDPERACPATTLYRSVQVHGAIEEITNQDDKAASLQALMEKYQPEGKHKPITGSDPLYEKAVRGVLVLGVSLERLDGKAKLAQNRTPDEKRRLVEKLWQRGGEGDVRAIEAIRAANPGTPLPAFLAGPEGTTLFAALGPESVGEAVDLLADAYWNEGTPRAAIARAQLGSQAWVGARDGEGKLVATARAISDHGKRAWIYDVMVAPAWRRRGLGHAVFRLLLDHPAVRPVREVMLGTRDAEGFYARFGFADRAGFIAKRPFKTIDMVWVKPA